MTGRAGQTLGDILGLLAALAVLATDAFGPLAENRLVQAVALFVLGLSLWRIARRHWPTGGTE